MHGEIMPLALSMEKQLFEDFSAADRSAFEKLLARLREAAGELDVGRAADDERHSGVGDGVGGRSDGDDGDAAELVDDPPGDQPGRVS